MLVATRRFQLHVTEGKGTLQAAVRDEEDWVVIWKAILVCFSPGQRFIMVTHLLRQVELVAKDRVANYFSVYTVYAISILC